LVDLPFAFPIRSHTKSASIAPFLPEVLSFFCHLPSAICLASTMQRGS
jgi:hypothetical protein